MVFNSTVECNLFVHTIRLLLLDDKIQKSQCSKHPKALTLPDFRYVSDGGSRTSPSKRNMILFRL